MLCGNLEGCIEGWGGKEAPEGGDICIHIADSCIQHKLAQHCKAIILQFKKKKKKQSALKFQKYWLARHAS